MPRSVRLMKVSATVTSEGNSFGGNTPARATISHSPNTTMKGNAFRAITRQRASSGARVARAARMSVSVVMSAMRDNSAIRQRPTRLRLGNSPLVAATLFYSRAPSPILSAQRKLREGFHVPRHQGHHSADDDHRLAAAAELVHRKSRHPAFPR